MKQLSAAAERAMRHRQWHWCRRPNGFSDMPRWRVTAARLGMPVFQVVAFVNRLEEFANASEHRGHIGHFDPAEFGAALGMAEEEAARIFAALEQGERPWIESETIADFFGRNPDGEDATFNERKRRSRTRTDVLKRLYKLARLGRIAPERRLQIEATLRLLPDPELFALQTELAKLELSTGSVGHNVTHRDIVTVTTEQTKQILERPVDNSGDKASGTAEWLSNGQAASTENSPQEKAQLWLATEGSRIVTERMMETRTLAATRVQRWLDQQLAGDAMALAEIIRAADATDYIGPRFHNLVVDGIKRAPRQGPEQSELKLPPVIASERKMA